MSSPPIPSQPGPSNIDGTEGPAIQSLHLTDGATSTYIVSDDTTVRLTRNGDIGELNLTDTTLVIDVDGAVKLVNQGPLPSNKIGQLSQFGKGDRPGHGRFQGRGRRGPGHGGFPRGASGLHNGGAAFGPSGLLDGLRLRLGELGGDGLLLQSLICDSEYLDKLPDSIVIRCETESGSETASANGDDAV